MQTNPDLKAFYCCNDTMALGVMQAVQNVGKAGKILVVGTDGTPEAVQMIEALTSVAEEEFPRLSLAGSSSARSAMG